MKFPAGTAFGSIGHPIRRKEDARLLTGKGRFTDDFSLEGQTYAAMVRSPHPHARIVRIDTSAAKAMPGVLAVLTGADCKADGIEADPAHAGARDQVRHEADRAGRRPGVRRPAHAAAGRQGAPRRRGGGDGGGRDPRAGDGRRRSGRGRIRGAAVRRPLRGCARSPARRWCGTKSPTTCSSTRMFGDKAKTDRAFAEAAHVVKAEFNIVRVTGVPMELRSCLAEFDAATGQYTLYAGSGGAVRQKIELAGVLGIAPDKLRVLSYDVGGNFGTRNRPYRRVRPGAVGGGQAQAPGQIHRDALGGVPHRLPGPRSRHQGRARVRQERPHPGDARRQHQQRRRALRVAVAAVEGLGPDHRLLRHSGGDAARARGVHQHHADQRLSLVRPARGDVRDRAADGHGGRPARHRPHPAAPQESREAEGDAVPQRRRHALRQRHLRGQHGPRHEDRRLGRLQAAQARGEEARQAARPRHRELCRVPRSARRRSAPRSR